MHDSVEWRITQPKIQWGQTPLYVDIQAHQSRLTLFLQPGQSSGQKKGRVGSPLGNGPGSVIDVPGPGEIESENPPQVRLCRVSVVDVVCEP